MLSSATHKPIQAAISDLKNPQCGPSIFSLSSMAFKTKPRRKYFLACFGFSSKLSVSDKKLSKDVVKSSKKNRFLPWSRFCMKKSAVKTVPVDTTSPKKLHRITEIVELATVPDQTVTTKPHKKRYEKEQNIILESGESKDSAKNNTWQKGVIRSRKKDAKRKSTSQQGSPVTNKKILSHSDTFSSIQVAARDNGDSRVKKKPCKGNRETNGKSEAVVGMSIIAVTLIIMIIWGKLCAILCTSAWLYFVPRLRKSVNSIPPVAINGNLKSNETDLSSEEYKKKVVLEGLLRRSHRNVAGVL